MRWASRIAFASLVLMLACDGEKTKSKDTPREGEAPDEAAEAKPAPKPKIDPHKTFQARKAAEPYMVDQEGKLELDVGDKRYHITDLPFGQNKATWFEGKKGVIGILGVAEEGYPKVQITMTGWRLDHLKLPITLTAEDDSALVRFTYWLGERGAFKSDDEATRRGENKVTLTKYEGKRLEGTFEATVAAETKAAGEPRTIKGEFSTTLRLAGVAPDLVASDDDETAADNDKD